MTSGIDRAAFVRANTCVGPVPHVPEVRLQLAAEATPLWQATEDALGAMGLPPPFWAFAWAGGQALARYVLDHPEVARGARVLDVAAGSGLVGIAAARAGAARVLSNDIDGFALAAIPLNAALNGVALEISGDDLIGRDDGWDVVLAADIFYERDTAARMLAWLRSLAGRGARVLVGDPGRAYFDRTGLKLLATCEVPVSRDLEDTDVKITHVWHVTPG